MTHAWMDKAWSHIGLHETAGNAATPEIVTMFASSGHPEVISDEVPWCAAFVGHCLKDASLPNTGSLMARSYLEYGSKRDEPEVGAIAVFKRGAPPSGHVAFVTGWGDGKVRVLGGNQGNKVCEASYPTTDVLGYRWPPEPPSPAMTVLSVAGPVIKSRTIWSTITALFLAVMSYVETAWEIITETAAKVTEFAGTQAALGVVGGNSKQLTLSLTVFALGLVITRRIKAKQPTEKPS